ncbi:MAG: GyrI-like domain-containing protein, partial [Firmicutes bacterium]|nr:GyrI-like domain-containing protein [Bacillota bacterium]
GVSPSIARTEGISLKAFPRISFTVSIKGDVEMNYKIEKKGAFKIVGVKEHMDIEESFDKIPLFWQKNLQAGTISRLSELRVQPPFGVLGISTCEDSKGFDYYIGVATDKPAPEGTVEYEVPACTWAIFECVGPVPLAIQELEKRIITEWLPTSGYDYANAPDIEVLTKGDPQSSTYRSEVWFPIKEKGR